MRNIHKVIFGMVIPTILAISPAEANVVCTPGNCVVAGTGKIAPKAIFNVSSSTPYSSGSISATLSNTVTSKGNFTDTFNFVLPANGTGGVSITTLAASFKGATDLDFTSVLVNGTPATIQTVAKGMVEFAFTEGLNLLNGSNSISVSGLSRGNGAYAGTFSFTPTIPEMSTWLMMILGFVSIGAVMRSRKTAPRLSFTGV